MIVYVSHSKSINYHDNLYEPIKKSDLLKKYKFIFPHENSSEIFDSKDLIVNKKCDFVLAEVSERSTGQGIELGWADLSKVPIICVFKKGSKVSSSLKVIGPDFIEYKNSSELISKLEKFLNEKAKN